GCSLSPPPVSPASVSCLPDSRQHRSRTWIQRPRHPSKGQAEGLCTAPLAAEHWASLTALRGLSQCNKIVSFHDLTPGLLMYPGMNPPKARVRRIALLRHFELVGKISSNAWQYECRCPVWTRNTFRQATQGVPVSLGLRFPRSGDVAMSQRARRR